MTEESFPHRGGSAISTGLASLDYILQGGYAFNRVHLIEGEPGSGKTTLGLQFLLDGQSKGERCLYITLSESRDELVQVAETHGWDMHGIEIFELVPPELSLDVDREQSIVYSSDLELGETVRMVMDEVDRVAPSRIVFDSLSEIRLLAQGPLRFRRQLLALKHYFAQRHCTALFLDDLTQTNDDLSLHSLAHGVLRLEQIALPYGTERRRLRVYKMRARQFRGGFHDFVIRPGGLRIFPRLTAGAHPDEGYANRVATSGIAELDTLTGGGIDYGTSTLVIGPSGSGKTTLTMQYVITALGRNEHVFFVSFDETERVFMQRAAGLGMDVSEQANHGRFVFRQVDPAEISPGELTGLIRRQVEQHGATVVVLDSLSGYQHAMLEEKYLLLQMHEIVTYLNQQGVLTFLVLTQTGMIGTMQSPVDLTYLSDSVMLLRFFESDGDIRRAMSFLKRRTGPHETTLREFRIDQSGIRVGPKLSGFRGVLTGTPIFEGEERLLKKRSDD
ncbi:ATPase domain-containing protein [Lichenifustis flavocetrariae]|uniref:non-specific serine/threonine protein kinase n=1 Tax=Lichenifustis flavocetrariae TaxID=2949735 RepID=A0AA41YU05_9HYPH|nr:ATPase domain-containing protein [Lichenifustis flavocetrariae]MCW6506823.1 AAA family ATPase [Lichenifustis flavocetrariae]